MANPVSGVSNAHPAAPATQTYQPPKSSGGNKAAGDPQDTVTISSAGSAASQAKAATHPSKGGDTDGK